MLRRAAPRHQDLAPRSPSHRRFERGHVDLLHRHHRLEGAFGYFATNRQGFAQNPWRNLPGDAPFVLAPAALTSLPTIADNGIPVAVCFFLLVGRDLEREGLAVIESGTALQTQ